MNPESKPRILIVDDDPNLRSAFKRTLSKAYIIDAAADGEAAMNALKRRSDYQVIIADMNMPGMTGLKLLSHAQRLAPDTVRIMLTGAEDQKVAADALNRGRVFRFLHKPCSGTEFMTAMTEALQHYRSNRQEREVFEKTFQGVINVLTEVLSAVEPATFGHGQQLARRALDIAEAINLESAWEIETAAMLLRIGVVTIPGPVLQRFNTGAQLSHKEEEMIARLPETGASLLAHVPRLEPIANIVRYQRKHFDGSGPPDDSVKGDDLPIGARIFCALLDLESHELKGMPASEALRQLQREPERYDPMVLRAMSRTLVDASAAVSSTMYLAASELRSGMVLASDAVSDEGVVIMPAGTTLTLTLIDRLCNFAGLGELQEPMTVARTVEKPEDPPADESDAA